MDRLLQDLKSAVRSLTRNPGVTAVIVLTLALGIGANTAIFSAVNAVLLKPLPYDHGDQVYYLQMRGSGESDLGFSVPSLKDYRRLNKTLVDLAEYHSMNFTLLGQGEPDRVRTGVVSPNFFEQLGVQPLYGRRFGPQDGNADADPVLVLSHEYWMDRFGGNPDIVGKTFSMNDRLLTVVGILPPVPIFPNENDVYVTLQACPARSSEQTINSRRREMLTLFGRVRPGVEPRQAVADLQTITSRLQQEYPDAYEEGVEYRVNLISLREKLVGDSRFTLWVLLGAVGFVLLIACANVANLTLVRYFSRESEMAARLALGASRSRLIRQILTETVLLALIGGALGLVAASWGVKLLVSFVAELTSRAGEIAVDGRVLAFTLLISVVTGVAFGLIPALKMSRNPDLGSTLREGAGRGALPRRQRHLQESMVAVQIGISFTLLVGALLLIQSLVQLDGVDAGFNTDHVTTATIALSRGKYKDHQNKVAFHRDLIERLSSYPGVEHVAVSNDIPLEGQLAVFPFLLDGQDLADGERAPATDLRVVTPDYFKTMDIKVLKGRMFIENDDTEAPAVVIVSSSFAEKYSPEREIVGRQLTLDGEEWCTIVGVVHDIRQRSLSQEVRDEIYCPYYQFSSIEAMVLVKSTLDTANVARQIRAAVREIDPEQPVANVRTLEDVRLASMASSRIRALLLGLFALVALAVSMAGIGTVVAFFVGRRTREIGLRMALGARGSEVVRLVMWQGLMPVAAGLVLGAVGALLLSRVLSGLLFQIDPTDPATYLGGAFVLFAVADLACFIPARRVLAINPTEALRVE